MLKRLGWIISAIVLVLAIGKTADLAVTNDAARPEINRSASAGDPAVLRRAYENWSIRRSANAAARQLVVPLAYSKARSANFTAAQGRATLDLASGALSVDLTGTEDEAALDLWLIDAQSADAEQTVRLGRLMEPDAGGLPQPAGRDRSCGDCRPAS